MKRFTIIGLWMMSLFVHGQTIIDADSISKVIPFDEVVISAYTEDRSKETTLNITSLQLSEIAKRGSFNLTDALANVPGVTQLSTGIGISKPVIRGLSGNRVLVVFSGLRFDNQQWQDEHGLGLSDIGISKVELIKGPLSLLYGTDAVGGVINILEEKKPIENSLVTDAGMQFHSNTLGGTLQAGIRANYGKRWFRIRVGIDNHADYSDGNNKRILNSRFNGNYLKTSFGFKRNNWQSDNYYNFSYNQFGFVLDDLPQFFEADDRWSRKMRGPHHIVMLHILSSVNTIQLKNSVLKLNAGIQSNYRAEDEGTSELSLAMHLFTSQYALKWSKQLKPKTHLVVANSSSFERNDNYGKRKIVPDAWMLESTVSTYLKHKLKLFVIEYGVGAGFRSIKTFLTPHVNTEDKEIAPFSQTRYFGNGMFGVGFNPSAHWNLKLNSATGLRAPNLAELSSNGLHEGIYRYEIGNPNLKNEQNLNIELSIDYSGKCFQIGVTGFYNYFFSYIYLEPTTEEWFGFPVARFKQHNAALYGGEATFAFTPKHVKGLKLTAVYSGLVGKLDNGDYLPYIPAQRVKPELRYDYLGTKKWKSAYGFVNTNIVMQQTLLNPAETKTPSYTLLNAGVGFEVKSGRLRYDVSVTAKNILNKAYVDHLSRYKPLGLLNIGRNISINCKINFEKLIKTHKNEINN